jgi:GNAT superfamily N-acetyltransferase
MRRGSSSTTRGCAHRAYQRFFSVMRHLPPDWARFLAEVDYRRRLALVVERGPREAPELIAVARYEPTDRPDTAEVAFLVLDGWQGKGIGTALLGDLSRPRSRAASSASAPGSSRTIPGCSICSIGSPTCRSASSSRAWWS